MFNIVLNTKKWLLIYLIEMPCYLCLIVGLCDWLSQITFKNCAAVHNSEHWTLNLWEFCCSSKHCSLQSIDCWSVWLTLTDSVKLLIRIVLLFKMLPSTFSISLAYLIDSIKVSLIISCILKHHWLLPINHLFIWLA